MLFGALKLNCSFISCIINHLMEFPRCFEIKFVFS